MKINFKEDKNYLEAETSLTQQAFESSTHHRHAELLGRVLGDYRLTAILGVGGVGTVYLGERADAQYSAQVAIKVVANTQLNHEVQRRFAAERQILANLNHPYIARLLDAGETFFDEPFLVMEYVQGESIDRYCDRQRLSVVERIRLFLKVCDAVQYAHRNLIVHRDLKPGNILVSKEGVPKLLDFGIAKLLDDSAQAISQENIVAHTRIHDRLLTPEYASPEQIRGQSVTTASDVYSLGVVLYELLTSTRPYSINSLNQLELERSVCIQDPIRPSQRIAELTKQVQLANDQNADDLQLIVSSRSSNFKKLAQQLQGDLDAIVLRALRKEPEHRYSSVEHLIDDLNNHLTRQPVEARQGNRWYYMQRFVKRHTLSVIAGIVSLTSLIAIAIILSLQARRLTEQRDIAKQQRDIATHERDHATQEASRAESVSVFMQEILTASDPYQNQDKQPTAKELLDKVAQRVINESTQQPEVRARLLEAVGKVFADQERSAISAKYLEEALQLQRTFSPPNNSRIATVLDLLGRNYRGVGDFDKASRALTEARGILERIGQEQSPEYLQVLTDSGALEQRINHIALAQYYDEKGLVLARKLHGNSHLETAEMLMQLAEVMIWRANYTEAERLISDAIIIYHAKLPDKHPDRINADLALADIFYLRGKLTQAMILISQGINDEQVVYGKDSPRLMSAYNSKAKVQIAQRKWSEAEQSARVELAIAEKNFGKLNFDTGIAHSAVANVLLNRKKFTGTELESRISLKILKATASPDHQYTASAEYLLAASLVGEHRSKEAESMLRANMTRWTRAEAPTWRVARSESLLGNALLQLHKNTEAAIALKHAYEVLSAKDSGANPDTVAVAKKRVDKYQQCVIEHRENTCQLSE